MYTHLNILHYRNHVPQNRPFVYMHIYIYIYAYIHMVMHIHLYILHDLDHVPWNGCCLNAICKHHLQSWMFVCVWNDACSYVCICIPACMCPYYLHIYVCMFKNSKVQPAIMNACTHAHVYAHACVQIRIRIYMHMNFTSIYIYIYTHTHTRICPSKSREHQWEESVVACTAAFGSEPGDHSLCGSLSARQNAQFERVWRGFFAGVFQR